MKRPSNIHFSQGVLSYPKVVAPDGLQIDGIVAELAVPDLYVEPTTPVNVTISGLSVEVSYSY